LANPWCRSKKHQDHEKEAAREKVNAAWDLRLGPQRKCASANCETLTRKGMCRQHARCGTHGHLFRTCQLGTTRVGPCVRSTKKD
jgi:hypothetical protein